MPKIAPDSPLLKNAPWEPLTSSLPDPTELERIADPLARTVAQAEWKLETGRLWQQGGQLLMRGLVTNLGVPDGKEFRAILRAVQLPNPALDMARVLLEELKKQLKELTKEIFKEITDFGIGLATDLMTAIPVVGWVADIVFGLVEAIRGLVKVIRAQNKPLNLLYERESFDPGFDSMFANRGVLDPVRSSNDWNLIFTPPGNFRGLGWVPLKGGGYRVSALGSEGQAAGYVPGTKTIWRAWELDPKQGIGGQIQTGEYLPTGRDMAVTAWGTVLKAGPGMYCVDAAARLSDWRLFLIRVAEFIATLRARNGKFASIVQTLAANTFHGIWGGTDPERAGNYTIPVKELAILEKRQWAYLDTVTCAYVDRSYGAFVNNTPLRQKLEQRQRQLLEHPAISLVDLEVVPDPRYRAQVEARQASLGPGFTVGGIASAPDKPRRQASPNLPGYREPPAPGGSSGGGAGAVLGIGALGLAGYFGYRYLWKGR